MQKLKIFPWKNLCLILWYLGPYLFEYFWNYCLIRRFIENSAAYDKTFMTDLVIGQNSIIYQLICCLSFHHKSIVFFTLSYIHLKNKDKEYFFFALLTANSHIFWLINRTAKKNNKKKFCKKYFFKSDQQFQLKINVKFWWLRELWEV